MYLTQPSVELLMKPQINRTGMEKWLKRLGAENYAWDRGGAHAESAVMAFAKRCYMAFEPGLNPNVSKVRDDLKEYLDNILSSGHGSVIAHAHFSFGIEGVSRVFTGEMNRHSAGTSISEGSMRFISFENLGLVETETMKNPKDSYDQGATDFVVEVFQDIEKAYRRRMDSFRGMGYDELPFSRKKALTSLMRRAIGMGVATGGVWTGNLRALRWICEQRSSKYAEEEILDVAGQILKIMMSECPNLFGDFHVDADGFWGPTHHKV